MRAAVGAQRPWTCAPIQSYLLGSLRGTSYSNRVSTESCVMFCPHMMPLTWQCYQSCINTMFLVPKVTAVPEVHLCLALVTWLFTIIGLSTGWILMTWTLPYSVPWQLLTLTLVIAFFILFFFLSRANSTRSKSLFAKFLFQNVWHSHLPQLEFVVSANWQELACQCAVILITILVHYCFHSVKDSPWKVSQIRYFS